MKTFDVLIEIPKGSRNKYEYDFEFNQMCFLNEDAKLDLSKVLNDKVLAEAMLHYKKKYRMGII